MPYQVARETSLQSFHYKVVNRFLACRANLCRWKKAPSPLCCKCSKIDTVEHHLYNCQTLQPFWNQLFLWLESIYGINMNLSVIDIIFGIDNENNDDILHIFNYTILFAKSFVYNYKIKDKAVRFLEYKASLLTRLEVEKHLSIAPNKLYNFNIVWNSILHK